MGEPKRSGLLLRDGAEVESGGRRFVIMQLLGFDLLPATSRPKSYDDYRPTA